MKSVNSISGGGSSAYMAYHYPADINIFACVLTEDPETRIIDASLRRYCQEKIPTHDWEKSGSRELTQTLKVLRDLEQLLGREIFWVHGPTFDELIKSHKALPNAKSRFCTIKLKIQPILQWLYLHHYEGEPFLMQIGFRADEDRNMNLCSVLHMPISCFIKSHRQSWMSIDIREATFPLFSNGIFKPQIVDWAKSVGLNFPLISNCDFCFHKSKSQLLQQSFAYPERVKWWLDQESKIGNSFYGNKSTKGCGCS